MGNAWARGGGQKRGGRERRGMTREYEQSLLKEIGVAPFFFGSRGALEFNMQGGPCCDPKTFDFLVLLRPTLELCTPPLSFSPSPPSFSGKCWRCPEGTQRQHLSEKEGGEGEKHWGQEMLATGSVGRGGWVQQLWPGNAGHFTGRWAGRAFGPGGRWPFCVGSV